MLLTPGELSLFRFFVVRSAEHFLDTVGILKVITPRRVQVKPMVADGQCTLHKDSVEKQLCSQSSAFKGLAKTVA